MQDVIQSHKVAMLACSLEDAMRVHSQIDSFSFNFIYMRPPSVEEFEQRLLKSH
jgi:guanylate kinase